MHEELLPPELSRFQQRIFALRKACRVGRVVEGPSESWLGGYPRVGPAFVWPVNDAGRPLSFVAQIRLADLALDSEGQLLFFYDGEHRGFEPKDSQGFAVRLETGQVLSERIPPVGKSRLFGLFERELRATVWPRVSVEFEDGFSYPTGGDVDDAMAGDLEVQAARDALNKINEEYEGNFWDAYIMFLGDVGQLDIQSGGIASPAGVDDELGARIPAAEMLHVAADELVLLLQLPSVGEMVWGDGGTLCWFIQRDDLVKRRFERSWMVMTSS